MVTSALSPTDVVVHTQAFHVHAKLHMRSGTSTTWLLNTEDRPFLSLTNVAMYRPVLLDPPAEADLLYETSFVAIPKAHVSWLVGGAPESGQDGFGRQPRQVYVMYPDYVLTGLFHMRAENRLSDFLATIMANKPFQTLFDAAILEPGPPGTRVDGWRVLQRRPFLTVNLRHASAIFDSRNPRDDRPKPG